MATGKIFRGIYGYATDAALFEHPREAHGRHNRARNSYRSPADALPPSAFRIEVFMNQRDLNPKNRRRHRRVHYHH